MVNSESLFFDVKLPQIAKDFALRAINSGYCGRIGEFVDKATDHIKKIFNREVLLTANGTLALELALRALDVGHSDIVLVQNTSFVATANAVNAVNAKIIFLENICNDIFPTTESISWVLSNSQYSSKIKALVVAPLYGICPDRINDYIDLCNLHEIYLIEDAAQSFASLTKEGLIGTFGDIATYSFFSNKTLSCGQGGALLFKNKTLADKAGIISKHGLAKGKYKGFGSNYGFNNLSASLLYANLLEFDLYKSKRKMLLEDYKKIFTHRSVAVKIFKGEENHIPWVLPISRINQRISTKLFVEKISNEGIAIRKGMNFLPYLKHFNTIELGRSIEFNGNRPDEILLPIHPGMDIDSINRIAKALKKHLN